MDMQVYEGRLKVFLLKDIPISAVQEKISALIDKALVQNEKMAAFHQKTDYKNYSFSGFYPVEPQRVYRQDKIYTIQIRTIDENLMNYFQEYLTNAYTEEMKSLTMTVRKIKKIPIGRVYTLTPVIQKFDGGYWKEIVTLDEFERRLKENLIKKYNNFMGEKCDEDFDLYTHLQFDNKGPISCPYKGITLLGDKITLQLAQNPMAQELAYMALGCGLGENNARGNGFCGYRYL
ncbi:MULTISPECIES: CRISPR-associated endoribonuclease Cas6 [Eubacterium]|uniref:CRISPR-associated endoribonuclease Cas6 n=1 Tax=Eubacterium TaxID=1730 RepID=UPI001CC3C838|nr:MULTISPECIES: CRISPR-associated endoribonuclease Cas6 [Eubacterium]